MYTRKCDDMMNIVRSKQANFSQSFQCMQLAHCTLMMHSTKLNARDFCTDSGIGTGFHDPWKNKKKIKSSEKHNYCVLTIDNHRDSFIRFIDATQIYIT